MKGAFLASTTWSGEKNERKKERRGDTTPGVGKEEGSVSTLCYLGRGEGEKGRGGGCARFGGLLFKRGGGEKFPSIFLSEKKEEGGMRSMRDIPGYQLEKKRLS